MFQRLIFSLLLLIPAASYSHSALGNTTFCNHADRPIYMAWAHRDNFAGAGWQVEAWWYAKSGECLLISNLSFFFGGDRAYYAISEDETMVWPAQDDWDNTRFLCINDESVSIWHAEVLENCRPPSYTVLFKRFAIGNPGAYTMNFVN